MIIASIKLQGRTPDDKPLEVHLEGNELRLVSLETGHPEALALALHPDVLAWLLAVARKLAS